MDEILNEAAGLDYIEPMVVLGSKEEFDRAIARHGSGLSENDRAKLVEEVRQAAAFCAGMGQLWKRRVDFSPGECMGCDAYLRIDNRDGRNLLGLLQLTQLPDESRSTIGLQNLIEKKLRKCNDPERLYLGVAVNRPGEIDLADIRVPDDLRGRVLEAWVFGRLAGNDRSQWFFYGDLEDNPKNRSVVIPDVLPLDI